MTLHLHFQRKLVQTLEALCNWSGSGVEFEQQRFLHRELLALVLHLRCELLPPVCVREHTRADKERAIREREAGRWKVLCVKLFFRDELLFPLNAAIADAFQDCGLIVDTQ